MFFGIGEFISVIANPSEVLKSLTESKRLLQEAQTEMREEKERAQIPISHTFSPLPGFFPRPAESKVLERAFSGLPAFTVLFGASSTGKTALLRQVLSDPRYHVLHFDLRIAGFADLESLYTSLAGQMEQYFAVLPEMMSEGDENYGWDEFVKQSWKFKHDRIAVEKRGSVRTADVARLMEVFQSALLAYWNFEPMDAASRKERNVSPAKQISHKLDPTEISMRCGTADELLEARTITAAGEEEREQQSNNGAKARPKLIPVLFFDESHKLPALIKDDDTMKALLDSFLVLTKQDRLCHCLFVTSDAYFMSWLRRLNVIQHASLLSIGDCSKSQAREYFEQHVRHVPDQLSSGIDFDECFEVFGGKLAHLQDYIAEYVGSGGITKPATSSHYIQAHALLNLHLIHSMSPPSTPSSDSNSTESKANSANGFQIYSPLQLTSSSDSSPIPASSPSFDSANSESGRAEFTADQLLYVIKLLTSSPDKTIKYFPLCRKFGVAAVDGMVRGRILELRWSRTITREGGDIDCEDDESVGPILLPTTPVVRYAMRQVIKEYEEEV